MDELFDSLLLECNNAVKMALTGNYIGWCGSMQQVAAGIIHLKAEVQKEIKSRDNETAALRRFVDDLNNGGADNGTD